MRLSPLPVFLLFTTFLQMATGQLGRSAPNPDPYPDIQAHYDISQDNDDNAESEPYASRKTPCLEDTSFETSENCQHKVNFVESPEGRFLSLELTSHLTAISGEYTKLIYPPKPVLSKALKRYAELPYPVPVGPSLFFCCLFLVLCSWYMARILTSALRRAVRKLDLHPDIQEFPHINQYSLQQSKREARLRREARNTWAWMARKYLLMQNDPKVNVDVFRTTWSDFDLPKDVWGIVRSVLKAGAWMNKRGDKKGDPTDKEPEGEKRKSVKINGDNSSGDKPTGSRTSMTLAEQRKSVIEAYRKSITPVPSGDDDEDLPNEDEEEEGLDSVAFGGLWKTVKKPETDAKRVNNWNDLKKGAKRASLPALPPPKDKGPIPARRNSEPGKSSGLKTIPKVPENHDKDKSSQKSGRKSFLELIKKLSGSSLGTNDQDPEKDKTNDDKSKKDPPKDGHDKSL